MKTEKEKKPSNLSRLLVYAGSHKLLTYLSWLLAAVSAVLTLMPFWYIWKIIKEALEVAPDFSRAADMIRNGWLAVLFSVLAVCAYIIALFCSHIAAFRVATNIRLRLTQHITELPLGEIEKIGSGSLRRMIANTSSAAETYMAHQLPDQAKAYASIVGMLFFLFKFDWRIALLSLIPAVIGFLSLSLMAGKTVKEKMSHYQDALSDMSNEAVEYVRGIPVVKTFGQSVFSFKRFRDSIDRYSKWATDYTKELRLPMMLYMLAINSVFIFLLIAGTVLTKGGVTQEFLINMLFYIIITPVVTLMLTKLMHSEENNMTVTDALSRIDSVLAIEKLTSADSAHPQDGSVSLEHVTFSYDGEKNALTDISLNVPAGKTVAFVGPSGGGKSTLAAIISRFFDPQSGVVRIGGADAREIPKAELMEHVSFVFQNSRLIKGSILDNIRMGKPDATDAEVMAAVEAAQCSDIIEKFPQGLQTVIGTKGVYLSGGEQQRLAIARAFLKNAPIIILDEATAFADPDNEAKVQQAFNVLAQDRTVIMIAHRLSTVRNADCIYVIREGEIAEQGSFAELTGQKGLFASMWENYQKSVEWSV